jgi:hypothetical protein
MMGKELRPFGWTHRRKFPILPGRLRKQEAQVLSRPAIRIP